MRWTVSRKISLAFIIMQLVLILTSVLSLNRMMFIERQAGQMTAVRMPKIEAVNRIHFETEHVLNLVYRHKDRTDADERKKLEDSIGEIYDAVDSAVKDYSPSSEEETSTFAAFRSAWDEFKKNTQKTLVTSRAGSPKDALVLIDSGSKIFDDMQTHLQHLVDLNQQGAAQSAADAKSAYAASLVWIYVILGVSILVTACINVYFIYALSRPLQAVARNIVRVSEGDLTVSAMKATGRDEIGQLAEAFNRMIRRLQLAIGRSLETSVRVTELAEELAAGAARTTDAAVLITAAVQEVAAGAQLQMTASRETSVAMEEMASGIGRISGTTSDMADKFVHTTDRAAQGTAAMDEAERQMHAISELTRRAAERISRLGERSEEIGGIVKLISEISYQTNLLALNASIEAARAGESGRGFAVVAAEVKKLAAQSDASAKEISGRIAAMQEETRETIQAMEGVSGQVRSGIAIVNESGQTFRVIVDSVRSMSEDIQEVSAAAEQMSAAAEQVAASVASTASIAQVSSENTMSVSLASEEQLASMGRMKEGADQLAKLAEELKDSIRHFRI